MKEKKSWVVLVRETRLVEMVLDHCTRDQAEKNPYLYAISDDEKVVEEWSIQKVESND